MRCPICKKPVEEPQRPQPGGNTPAQPTAPPRAASFFPFCSERCKLIDLGRWLDGKYQVPVVEEDGDEPS
jgi:hypothetical protein